MPSELLRIFFVLLLVVAVPVLSYQTARDPRLHQVPRLGIYFSALLSQWVLAAVGIVVVLATPVTFRSAGFAPVAPAAFLRWAAILVIVSLAAMGLSIVLEKFGLWPEESPLVRLLIPESGREKLWAVLTLAPTAGLCEEFIYRGCLFVLLVQWFRSVPWAWAASSLAFGLAHTYQGAAGVLRAAALGALLAYPMVHLGSLYPSMAAHFVIDAVALGWLGPAFLEKEPQP
jgi:CAAX protease family protein